MTGIFSAKTLLCHCSLLFILLASPAWAAPSGQPVSPRQQAFIEQIGTLREALKKIPKILKCKKTWQATFTFWRCIRRATKKPSHCCVKRAASASS